MKFPYLVQKKLKEGQEIRRVSQLEWKIIESDHEKPFVASGMQFFPLPVTCFDQSLLILCCSYVQCQLSVPPLFYLFYQLCLFIQLVQVMHGEDYVSLGFLFGKKCKVAYISDVSRFIPSTEAGECVLYHLFLLAMWLIFGLQSSLRLRLVGSTFSM